MAKQPETLDRYRIHCDDISLEGLGVVIAALTRLGVAKITHELVTDILAYKIPARVYDTASVDIARTFVSEHQTFKARELTRVFEQEGRSVSVGFSAIKKLVESGELRQLGGGNYQSTNVKALAAPAADAEVVEPTKRGPRAGIAPKRYPISNIVVVWNAIERRKTVTRAEIAQIMIDNDRPKKSLDGVVGKLKDGGRLKSVSEGVYEVIKPKSAKEKRNG